MSTLDLWRGNFGNSYHDRNKFLPEHVRPLFARILGEYEPFGSVLEVGCGLGHNLMAIDAETRSGIEPNKAAREEALRAHHPALNAIDADAADLPYASDSYDLVLTCGLLIHIPPQDIQQVVEEIARVSSKLVLCIEYNAVEEEMREYRGVKDALWVRPYGKLFQTWGGMKLLAHDDEDTQLHPGCSWWLCEKGER